MPFDDRDPKFERALAQHLRGGSAQANCPDAETLAAYHERNLSLEEMARWKEHISACESCQETLALVETTENQLAEDWKEKEIPVFEAASIEGGHAGEMPTRNAKAAALGEPQAAASPVVILRRRPALFRWAIPLGAVAAGVLVFIGIYEQRAAKKLSQSANTEVVRNLTPAGRGPIADQSEEKLRSKLDRDVLLLDSGESSKQEREPKLPAEELAKPAGKAKDSENKIHGSRDQFVGGRLEKKTLSPQAPAPSPPRKASTDTAVSENAPAIAAALPDTPPPPAPPVGVGGAAGAGYANPAPSRADAKNAPPAVTQSVTVQSQAPPLNGRNKNMMTKQGVDNEVMDLSGSATDLILTPDNRVFWKLLPAGTVQLTTDGGKDWKSLETGANEDLTMGFAPSSNVCWIAGRSGTLLLTKDRGTHWSRINTPIAGDLGGVRAADAKHAYIWDTARHTSYETSDGGSTWKQTTNQ